MTQFNIIIPHRPGALAELCEKLSFINIEAISTEIRSDNEAIMKIITNDESTTKKVLDKHGFEYKHHDIILVKLDDQPGTLKKLTKKVADAGINLKSLQVTGKEKGKTHVAITADNMISAKELLREYN